MTRVLVRSVTFGYRSAGSTHTMWASAFPLTRQGYPSQVAQRMQGENCGADSS